ncbi:MAG: hypothetical protein RL459_2084 [Pseudomonadota bacterium]
MVVQDENEYEDLLSLWSDLESGLGVILSSPSSCQEFKDRVEQYDRWLSDLLAKDTDLGLYLLFQLAINSPVGYSASHALVCAVLCHLISAELSLPQGERDSLVRAALTMNIGMTTLQDVLADQVEKPSAEQQLVIRSHPMTGGLMLNQLGVADALWLDIVSRHHDEGVKIALRELPAAARLSQVLRLVDRYAAMISPRKSRSGRTAADSARSIFDSPDPQNDEVAQALLNVVGMSPPGTYVQLDSEEVAVVMRRSRVANQPHVAVVVNDQGNFMRQPRLHRTAQGGAAIRSALPASAVSEPINHYRILQLGEYAAQAD